MNSLNDSTVEVGTQTYSIEAKELPEAFTLSGINLQKSYLVRREGQERRYAQGFGDSFTVNYGTPGTYTLTEGLTLRTAHGNVIESVGRTATITVTEKQCVHNFTVISNTSTCTENGVKTERCTKCGETKTTNVTATGHTPVADYQWDADTHWKGCSTCGLAVNEAAHNTSGINGTCSVCGYDPNNTCDHDYGEDQDDMYHWYECNVHEPNECPNHGKLELGVHVICPASSPMGEYTATTDYNCQPNKGYVCKECGNYFGVEENHKWVLNKSLSVAATADAPGKEVYTCDYNGKVDVHNNKITCNAKKEITIPALGHNWDYANPVSDTATCTADGQVTYKCLDTGCTKTLVEKSYATGHNWGEWTVTEAATCTADGEKSHTCSKCGTIEKETIDKLTHTASAEWVTDENYHWHTCKNCSEKLDYDVHAYDNEADTTCNTCGYERTVAPTVQKIEEIRLGGLPEISKDTDVSALKTSIRNDFASITGLVSHATSYPQIFFVNKEHNSYDSGVTSFVEGETYYAYWVAKAADGYELADNMDVYVGSTKLSPATNVAKPYTGYKIDIGSNGVKMIWIMVELKWAEHTHSYGTEWKHDKTHHWHECSCGDKTDKASHTASDWIIDTEATATTNGTKHKECTVCHYEMETDTIPATGGGSTSSHEHTWSTEWATNETHHWHECTATDCDVTNNSEKNGYAAHEFEWVTDKEATATEAGSKHEECKICGYEKDAVEIPATGTGGETPGPVTPPTPPAPPSSGGGSGFSGKYNYPVVIDTDDHATAKADKNHAVAGDKVTITISPEAGYAVDEVVVTDKDNKVITASKAGDNTYSFTMPEGKVKVAVTTEKATYSLKLVLQIGNKNIVANGKPFAYDTAPIIDANSRTLVPIRVITEQLGGQVDWNEKLQTVTLKLDGKMYVMTIGKTIPGFDTAAIIDENGRTLVPVRYVAEKLGARVDWIAATQQVVITK